MTRIFVFTLLLFFLPEFLSAQIVQWRGADRTGIYPDRGLLTSWPAEGPHLALTLTGIGDGHSSPVKWKDRIYVSGMFDTLDVLSCFNMNGDLLWKKTIGKSWSSSFPDSRNTPTIINDRLYIASGMGEVVCFEPLSGKELWRKNPQETYQGRFGNWGFAESLLPLDIGAILVSVGGDKASFVALDMNDGHEVWKSEITDDRRSYSSPLLIDRNGRKIIVAELSSHVYGINPENGQFYWSFDLLKDLVEDGGRRNSTNTPTYRDGMIFLTAGYNATAVMLSLSADGLSVSKAWTSTVLDNHFGGTVALNGYIYGSNWLSNSRGNWICLDWKTGKVMYDTEWHNKGPVIAADGFLYLMEEKNGEMALVKADHESFKVVSSFFPFTDKGPYWAHPAIFDGQLYLRHAGTLKIFDLR
ncbi:MAG: PQQ-binding-like beta-propeller repeat protein [Bacteroidota bacterium]